MLERSKRGWYHTAPLLVAATVVTPMFLVLKLPAKLALLGLFIGLAGLELALRRASWSRRLAGAAASRAASPVTSRGRTLRGAGRGGGGGRECPGSPRD